MVVRVPCGRWVATAGQVALDDEGHLVGPGDLEAQAHQVFAHLNRALAAAGASFADIVKLNCYLTDITPLRPPSSPTPSSKPSCFRSPTR
jgi:enamine deaminase RidA (YjgF/YER057c/UK114 family)